MSLEFQESTVIDAVLVTEWESENVSKNDEEIEETEKKEKKIKETEKNEKNMLKR